MAPFGVSFHTESEGEVVNQDHDHLYTAQSNGFAKPHLAILACLTALLPISAVAQAPSAAAILGPAVVVLHISGHVPHPGGSVALLLGSGSRIVVAATDIDAALTRSANDTLRDKQARGRAPRRAAIVVIHITTRVSHPDGSIEVLLASGSRLVLAATYIDAVLTRSINDRISAEQATGGPAANQPQWVPGPEPTVFPPDASAQPTSPAIGHTDTGRSDLALPPSVIAQCAQRWPDFALQEYCLEEQQKGADALERRSRVTVTVPRIRRECARKWPDDLAMRDYCERTHVETPWWIGGRR